MPDMVKHSAMIKAEALRLGFDACGIARASSLVTEAKHLSEWLANGFQGTMKYMEKLFEKRKDPSNLVKGTNSIVSVILNYYTDKKQLDPAAPIVSKYAYGKDYHEVIRKKLKLLLHFITTQIGPTNGKGFTDSAPVMDKAWAARAGLGWIGKNTNLISLQKGSFVYIGTLLINRQLHYDSPVSDRCGTCMNCLEACPTKAIVQPYVVDGSRCISYLTIENKGEIPSVFRGKFKNRVFGCDICQDVCPWNRKALPHSTEEFSPIKGLLEKGKEEWYRLSEQEFDLQFSNSAIKRPGYIGLIRNLIFLAEDGPVTNLS
jgi:epoxyqueuosine reductase